MFLEVRILGGDHGEMRGPPLGAYEGRWGASGHGGGGSDKIAVPEFDGEELAGQDGSRVRGYIRRVNAWRRITPFAPNKQALSLYNHVGGKAWRDAEEIDLDLLDQDSRVDVFLAWVLREVPG